MTKPRTMLSRRPDGTCGCGCGLTPKTGRNFRPGHRPSDIRDRILTRIVVTPTGCWEWLGATTQSGYGHINIGGLYRGVHRTLYELEVCPLTSNEELDHLCRNRLCCRPEHLEPVTHEVNAKRGVAPMVLLHNAGVCMNGHSAAEHAYRRKDTGRVVYCRACRREKRAQRRATQGS